MTRILLLISTLFLITACGKKASTNATISIVSGLSSVTTLFAGGAHLFATNSDTGVKRSIELTDTTMDIEFDNGTWDLSFYAWDDPNMGSMPYCNKMTGVVLDGAAIELSVSMLQDASCQLTSNINLHSPVMGATIPIVMPASSIKVHLLNYDSAPKHSFGMKPGLNFSSHNICVGDTGLTVNDPLDVGTYLQNIPEENAPFYIEVFDGVADCSGSTTREYFSPTGIYTVAGDLTADLYQIPLTDFIFTVKVLVGGNSFVAPVKSGGTYNFTIDYGDGSASETIVSDAPAGHTYSATGQHLVRISGEMSGVEVADNANMYVENVMNLGDTKTQDYSGAFHGLSNSGVNLNSIAGGFTSSATDMSIFLRFLGLLTRVDLSSFDTSNVTSMSGMFASSNAITHLNLKNFNTSKVTDMTSMFNYCQSLEEINVSSFDTTNVTNMTNMFKDTVSLTSLDLSSFKTPNLTSMHYMFRNTTSLTDLDISNFETSSVTSMLGAFEQATSLTSLDLSHFDTSSLTNMSGMFSGATNLTNLNISSFDTSNVTIMTSLFAGTSSLTSLDLSHFNTSNVTTMASMFKDMTNLTSLNVSSFDTSLVTNMAYMFSGAQSLTFLNTPFDTTNVTNMAYMFSDMTSLNAIDFSSFDYSSVTDMSYFLSGSPVTTIQDSGTNYNAPVLMSSTSLIDSGTCTYDYTYPTLTFSCP